MFRTSQSPETMCSKGLLVKPVSKRPSLGSGSSSKFGSTAARLVEGRLSNTETGNLDKELGLGKMKMCNRSQYRTISQRRCEAPALLRRVPF